MKKIIILFVIFFVCFTFSYAQPGELDPSFGTNGITRTYIGANSTVGGGGKVLLQSDGSIYTVFNSNFSCHHCGLSFIAKRNPDGSADVNFGNNGFSVGTDMYLRDAAIGHDGKIVMVGLKSVAPGDLAFAVSRFNTDGSLDSTFSEDGRQTTNFSSGMDDAYSVAIQNDGKIVVAGFTGIGPALVRYNIDGNLDNTFSEDGKRITEFYLNSIAIQEDGKIVGAGIYYGSTTDRDFGITRYNSDGSLDNTFSGDGNQTTDIGPSDYPFSMAIQSDGKIVVAGYADSEDDRTLYAIARYNSNGNLDITLDGDGIKTTLLGTFTVAIQKDNKILVAGRDGWLTRYNYDGSLDNTFDEDGKINGVYALSLAIHTDGKIVISGTPTLARYNTDGSEDNTFGDDGKVTFGLTSGYTIYKSSVVQKDGKIVVAGSARNEGRFDFAIARYNSDGNLDNTFSEDGKQTTDFGEEDIPDNVGSEENANSIAIQNDGKIVVVGTILFEGEFDFAIARYNPDGSLDSTFSNDGKQTTNFYFDREGEIRSASDNAYSVAIQSDGKIVVAGTTENHKDGSFYNVTALARYNSDGSLDNTFNNGKQINDFTSHEIVSIAIQPDGKIVLGSSSQSNFDLARYNSNGSLDSSFSGDGRQTTGFEGVYIGNASSVAVQSDGKIVVSGTASDGENYTTSQMAIARYNTDGNLDSSFSDDGRQMTVLGGSYATANSLAIQNDGKILVAGTVGYDNGNNTDFGIARYNTDGNLDNTFSSNGIQVTEISVTNDHVNNIAIWNNKLYAVGYSEYLGNVGVVARFLLDDENNTPPTVSITTPTNNATFGAGAYIKINATASDADGTISKVEFYNGNTLLHTETVAPYGHQWKHVPAGNYTLTVKATDNSGLVTTSAPVNITVVPNIAPTVNITNPANNQTIAGPATIRLQAFAKDADGKITSVEFFNGTTLLRIEYKLPYTFVWRNVPVGNYSITAKTTDDLGAVTTSAVVNISVVPNKAPTVSIINPAGNESIINPAGNESFTAPATIPLIASAQDPDGTISRVEFYNGSTLLNTQYKTPYTHTLQDVPAGTYTITAKAIDNLGLSATSAPVTVTVAAPNTIVSSKPAFVDNKADVTLKAWPNPASNVLNISAKGLQQNKQATITIISTSGLVIKTMQPNSSTQTIQLDVSSLLNGVYMIKLISGDKVLYKQFVKL